MIVSMTGFGIAAGNTTLGHFQVEIKSVNSRYLELNFRIPPPLAKLEFNLRQLISSKIQRGKVDIFIKWEESQLAKPKLKINEIVIKELHRQLTKLAETIDSKAEVNLAQLLHLPGCIEVEEPVVDEKQLWRSLQKLVKQALDRCHQFRVREGKSLHRQLSRSLKLLRHNYSEIIELKECVIENYRQRLREKVAEFNKNNEFKIDNGRLEAEVLFFADKADITEELTRIKAHLEAFKKYLADKNKGQVGKALDFLTQEILREINTLASKTRDTQVAQRVLLMKNEVEKIREQVQNIE
ncbi:MAG: YicC family protein [Candidatus Sumerlaeia bacterium]|nr:YicC family protein [Candidatus Sumerlaeia bacterium]